MGNGCTNCLKVFLAIINVLFMLVGLAILAGAIFLYFDSTMQSLKSMSANRMQVDIALFVLMGVGGLTVLVSAFGCCGAYLESRCLLSVYVLFLLLIVGAEVAGVVLACLKRNDPEIQNAVIKSVADTLKSANATNVPSYIKKVQQMFECCGANNTEYDSATKAAVCVKDKKQFTEGCVPKLFRLANDKAWWLLIVISPVAALELISIILALGLCCSASRDEEGYVGVSAD